VKDRGAQRFPSVQDRKSWYLSILKSPSSLFQRQLKSIKKAAHSVSGKYAPRNSKVASLDFPLQPTVLFFFILWMFVLALTWASPLPSKFKRLHADRVMSTLHSMIAGAAGITIWVSETPECSLAHPQRHWIRLMMLITVSYLWADICSMVCVDVIKRWRSVDLPMLMHHFFVIGTYTWAAENNVVLWFAGSLLVNAFSVGPLNAVYWLRYYGHQNTMVYKVTGAWFVLSFFLSRIVLIPWSAWLFTKHGSCQKELTWVSNAALFCYAAVYALNIWWFVKIARAASKALKDKPPKAVRRKEACKEAWKDAVSKAEANMKTDKFLNPDYLADAEQILAEMYEAQHEDDTDPSGEPRP